MPTGLLKTTDLDDRRIRCPECGRSTIHAVLCEYETTERDNDSDIQVWDRYRLVQCRGCLTVSYEHVYQCTEDRDEDGSLLDIADRYPPPADEVPEGALVILMTDLVDSTELTEELGDEEFRARAQQVSSGLNDYVRMHRGVHPPGNVLGDGILAVFRSAKQALACALSCSGAAEEHGMKLHIGMHAGDVLQEDRTVYGGAVNVAARITSAAAPGEILVSDTVRGLARTSTKLRFDDRGEQRLKGVAEPIRLFALLPDRAVDQNGVFAP